MSRGVCAVAFRRRSRRFGVNETRAVEVGHPRKNHRGRAIPNLRIRFEARGSAGFLAVDSRRDPCAMSPHVLLFGVLGDVNAAA
jgi:hypothetical protein